MVRCFSTRKERKIAMCVFINYLSNFVDSRFNSGFIAVRLFHIIVSKIIFIKLNVMQISPMQFTQFGGILN